MFGIFQKWSKRHDILGSLRKSTKVENYTNAFLIQVARSKTKLVRVRKSDGLPAVRTNHGEYFVSDYDKVLNHLKVCSLLDPIRYSEPVDGKFGISYPTDDGLLTEVKIETHFDDRDPDPFFEIKISRDAR